MNMESAFDRHAEDYDTVRDNLKLMVSSAVIMLLASPAFAADISLHGFLQGNYSSDTVSSNPDGGDFKLAEERLQIKLDA